MLRAWICLFAILSAIYVGTSSPDYYPGDDRYYLNLAGQLVEEHSVALRWSREPDPDAAFRGADGRVYAKYTLGHPAALGVAYALVRPLRGALTDEAGAFVQRLALACVPAFAIAGALVLAGAWAHGRGYPARTCVLWVLGMGLATNLWPATKTLLSEPTQCFCVTLIGLLALRAWERPTTTLAAALGLACAYAYHVKITLLLAAGVAGLVVALPGGRRLQRLAAFGAPLAVALALMLVYNTARCGTPWVSGYQHGQDTVLGFCVPWWSGLPGLLLSPGKGLVFYSPFLILAVAGARAFHRRHAAPALILAGLTLPHVALYATWNSWHGDWSWGPRFLVTFHPLLGLFALPALVRLEASRRGRWLLGAVLALGVGVQLLGVVFEPFTYIECVKSLPIAAGSDKLADTPPDRPFVIDGLLHNHWWPSFSPLLGHLWLARRMVQGPRLDDAAWSWFGRRTITAPLFAPSADLWWPRAPAAAALCALIVLAGALGLARRMRAEPAPAPLPGKLEVVPAPPVQTAEAAPGRGLLGTGALLLAVALAALPAAFADAAVNERVGLITNALAGVLAALLTGRAAARLDASVDPRRVAGVAFLATLLWPRTRELSLFAPMALLAASVIDEALTRGRTAHRVAVLFIGAAWLGEAHLRSFGPARLHVGLYALVLSVGKSLVVFAPAVLLALPALRALAPRARFLASIALVSTALEAAGGGWAHDVGWGPPGLAPALVALLVLAGPALTRPTRPARALLALSLAVTLAGVLVSPRTLPRLQAEVPGLCPPGHPNFRPGPENMLSGLTFVPDLSPVPGHLWLVRCALTGRAPRDVPAPWTGVFWRGYAARSREVPRLDLVWTARRSSDAAP